MLGRKSGLHATGSRDFRHLDACNCVGDSRLSVMTSGLTALESVHGYRDRAQKNSHLQRSHALPRCPARWPRGQPLPVTPDKSCGLLGRSWGQLKRVDLTKLPSFAIPLTAALVISAIGVTVLIAPLPSGITTARQGCSGRACGIDAPFARFIALSLIVLGFHYLPRLARGTWLRLLVWLRGLAWLLFALWTVGLGVWELLHALPMVPL